MKKLSRLSVFFFLSALFFAPVARGMVLAPAPEQKIMVVSQEETIDDDLFLSADEVLFEGTVNGDLYAAGGMVTIRGQVNGDVLAVGGNIEISGSIRDDVRVAGGNIRIDEAQIGDSVTVAGGNISIDETTIGGGLMFAGGSVVARADVARGVTGGGGSVGLEGKVAKDVQVGAGTLSLGSGAQVGGDLVFTSDQEPRLIGEATVSGQIRRLETPPSFVREVDQETVEKVGRDIFRGFRFGYRVWSYIAALLVGALLVKLAPKHAQGVADVVKSRLFGSLGWGLLIFLVAGPVFIIGLLTVVGIPLTLIAGGLFLIDLYLTKLFVGIALGQWLSGVTGQKMGRYLSFAVGLAFLYLLRALPYVGFLAGVGGLFAGLGALVLYKYSLWTKRG